MLCIITVVFTEIKCHYKSLLKRYHNSFSFTDYVTLKLSIQIFIHYYDSQIIVQFIRICFHNVYTFGYDVS